MTPEQFAAWRRAMYPTPHAAATALGMNHEMVAAYERGCWRNRKDRPYPIPRVVELACAALAQGITEYDGRPLAVLRSSGR